MNAPMSGTACPTLQTLVRGIDQALDGAPPEDIPRAVCAALRRHASLHGLLDAAQRQGGAQGYTRHVLHAHPAGLYTMVALVWRPGQITPIHGHYTWCSYIVLEGLMREEHFQWLRDQQGAVKTGQVMRKPGDALASHAGLEDIHRLCNVGDEVAVSIHVYGVAAQRVSSHVNRIARDVQAAQAA